MSETEGKARTEEKIANARFLLMTLGFALAIAVIVFASVGQYLHVQMLENITPLFFGLCLFSFVIAYLAGPIKRRRLR